MAMMAKMRSLAPAFIITVGALFVLFMVISDSNVLEALGGSRQNVGSINGEEVSYQDFSRILEQQRENMRLQSGKDVEEENMDQLRDQVWDAVVTQKLLDEQIKKFGITVSDEEIEDIILGPNPPEFLRSNFIDSTGNFNRQIYDQAIRNPQNRDAMLQAEEMVRQQRLNEKLQSMLLASITVSEAEIKRSFVDQNTSINAQYALVDISKMPDSLFQASDDEVKDYYNNNLDRYKVQAQRKLKYVLFGNEASREDTSMVVNSLENIKARIESNDTLEFSEAVTIYSTVPYSVDTLSLASLTTQAADQLAKASPGSIVGPVPSPQGYALYNLTGSTSGGDQMASASHILINQFGSDEQNLQQAEKIYNDINTGNITFEEAAREFSQDPGSAANNGSLGWFSRGTMVPEFDKAVFEGTAGQLQKPVKTNFGYHIIRVDGKSSQKFIVEQIVQPVTASAATKDNAFQSADDFAYVAEQNGFEHEAQVIGKQVQETAPFTEDAYAVPGIGMNKRLIEYAFDADKDEVSKPFRLPQGYVVVVVSDVIKEGARPFEEVKNSIRPAVIKEKKYSKAKSIAEDIKKKVNGNLSQAAGLSNYVVVEQTGTFTPGGSIPNIGRDYAFIDKVLDLKENSVSEPFKGQKGYYIVNVTSKTPFDKSAYETQRSQIAASLLEQKKSTYFNQWLANLKKEADIVDNRHMFFGQ